jgi:subtilisin family serine protease
MSSCFDYLTSHGRNGKGVMLFFSAGNDNKEFQLERPWAAYEKTVAVAASTNNDVKASYSNFGDGIDVCAPSSDGIGITTTHLVGKGNAAGHTAGSLDYTRFFGGTSSATALTAGVGAIILSVNPDLYWHDVRKILRETAIEIDTGNTDNVGRWRDINGLISSDPAYQGAYYSQWYGYGRIDALGAVHEAIVYISLYATEVDLSRWAAVFILILGGATRGGGGIGIDPHGGPHPIDPHGPFVRLSKDKRDILIGLAVTELASIINNSKSKLKIEKVGAEVMSEAIKNYQKSLG